MSTPICRVCLASNRKMYNIENIELRTMFEKLTQTELNTQHGANMMCYICNYFIKRCVTFSQMVHKSDIILNTLYDEGFEPTEESLQFTNIDTFLTSHLTISSVTYLSTDSFDETMKVVTSENDELYKNNEMDVIIDSDISNESFDLSEKEDSTSMETIDNYSKEINDNDIYNVYKSVVYKTDIKKQSCHIDEKPFIKEELTEHDLKKKLYTCHFCNKTFKIKINFDKHMHKHKLKRFSCTECDRTFANYSYLMIHKKTHYKQNFTCKICNKSFCNRHVLTNHIKKKHEANENNTKTDEFLFISNNTEIQEAENDIENDFTKEYTCDICHLSYTHEKKFQKHLLTHKFNGFPCKVCKRMYASRLYLLQHMKSHKTEKNTHNSFDNIPDHKSQLFDSDLNQNFKDNDLLIDINLEDSKNKQYICEKCNKVFKFKSKLKTHIKTHIEGVYICNECDRTYKTKETLSRHIKTHYSQTFYTCDRCGKVLSSVSCLRSHIQQIHMDERPYKCDLCTKSFKRKFQLLEHSRVHTGLKPYSCDICDKKFTQSSSLGNHKKIHSGKRPYICEVCTKTFIDKYSLQSHMIRHTGEKKFACHKCTQMFTKNSSLNKHFLRFHTPQFEESESCGICYKTFNRISNLRRHIKKIHAGHST